MRNIHHRTTVATLIGTALLLTTGYWGCGNERTNQPAAPTVPGTTGVGEPLTKGDDYSGLSTVSGVGSYNVAVILIQPPGTSWVVNGTPIDPVSYVNDIMFDASDNYSVADAYQEMSYGQLTLTGHVFEPIVLTDPALDISNGCNADWEGAALDLAAAPPYNYDFSGYDLRMYVYPPEVAPVCHAACNCNGYASGTEAIVYNVWDPGVYIHELGHLFGLGHATAIDLNAATQDGQLKPYGDYSCFMSNNWVYPPGWSIPLHQANGPHKMQAGWIPSDHIMNINTLGTFTGKQISPLEIDPTSCLHDDIIRITHPTTGQVYILSYRYPASSTYDGNPDVRYVFQNFLTVDFFESVNIHTGATVTSKFEAALHDDVAGEQTWQNADHTVTVTQTAHDEYGATVNITLVAPDVAPSLSITPTIQYGIPGTGLDTGHTYTLTITNPNAASHTYALSETSPAFFNPVLGASEVTLPASGSTSMTVMLDFQSPGSEGSYSFTILAQDTGNQALSRSVQATYFIDTNPPTTPTSVSTYLASCLAIGVHWAASTDGLGSGVKEYEVQRNGVVIGTTASTSYIDADPNLHFATSYTYRIRAVDWAGHTSGWSSGSTFASPTSQQACGNQCRGCPPPYQLVDHRKAVLLK